MSVVAVLFGTFLFFVHEAHGRQVFPYFISEYNETEKLSKERLPQSGGSQQFWGLTKDHYSDQIMPTDDASHVDRWELYVINSPSTPFFGSTARLNTWAIPQVQADQISSLAIWVVGGFDGPPENINAIQAGWHVYPQKYQDTQSHFFISWTSDKYQRTGCYNLDCPGFVLNTSSGISPGMALPRVSSFNGDQYYLTLWIEKDINQGDWLLNVAKDGEIVNVGFWPNSLFTSLKDHGSQFTYGGGTTSSPNEPSPPMGNGQFAGAGDGKAANIKGIQLRMEHGKYVTPLINMFERAPFDESSCYGLSEISKEDDGDKFFVGGPGGCK